MPEAKLFSPRVKVILATDDGSEPKEQEIQTTNADLVLWDRTRAVKRWPKFDDAPFLWLTFLSWAAMRRTGEIPVGTKYEEFEAQTLSIANADDDNPEPVDPTQPGAVPG